MDDASVVGEYGAWAASLVDRPRPYSFRHERWTDVDAWREAARERVRDRIAPPDLGPTPDPTVEARRRVGDLAVEELSWDQPAGRPTAATLLKPANAETPLPGVLALHDHGGLKRYGRRKIADAGAEPDDRLAAHREACYDGRPWANALARRGYAVLVPDAFAFGSRRVSPERTVPAVREGLVDADPTASPSGYEAWAARHESVLAKSLFAAGTSWPGVALAEDRRALDVLCARDEVDESRIGCGGLSGGGLRTVYLGGMDPRIDCAVCVDMCSTWRDFVLFNAETHTWMVYPPGLPREMDYGDVLALRAPDSTLVQHGADDDLFDLDEVSQATDRLEATFEKAGASDSLECSLHSGGHAFDRPRQAEAFRWFDDAL